MQSSGNDERSARGTVKWFDSSKGFGFIVSDDVASDVLLHANVLRNYGQSSVAEGARIVFTWSETERGLQAVEISEIEAPEPTEQDPPLTEIPFPPVTGGGSFLPARVKWFDRVKGFGFANVFGSNEDVFIHMEVLRRSALADLQSGEAVALRLAKGERGLLATQVSAWESGLSEPSSESSPSEAPLPE